MRLKEAVERAKDERRRARNEVLAPIKDLYDTHLGDYLKAEIAQRCTPWTQGAGHRGAKLRKKITAYFGPLDKLFDKFERHLETKGLIQVKRDSDKKYEETLDDVWRHDLSRFIETSGPRFSRAMADEAFRDILIDAGFEFFWLEDRETGQDVELVSLTI